MPLRIFDCSGLGSSPLLQRRLLVEMLANA
jgi:hypothetical protein